MSAFDKYLEQASELENAKKFGFKLRILDAACKKVLIMNLKKYF